MVLGHSRSPKKNQILSYHFGSDFELTCVNNFLRQCNYLCLELKTKLAKMTFYIDLNEGYTSDG